MLKGVRSKWKVYLQPVDQRASISEQVVSQLQPHPGLTLHRLVQVNLHIHWAIALYIQTSVSFTGRLTQKLWNDECWWWLAFTPELVLTLAFLPVSPTPAIICWTDIYKTNPSCHKTRHRKTQRSAGMQGSPPTCICCWGSMMLTGRLKVPSIT